MRTRRSEIVIALLVLVYTIIFSSLTILRYESLKASAYDLGNYNQAFFTTTNSGRFFYYTSDLPANPNGSVFGTHFLPIFFLILPFYYLIPSVDTLLVIQSFALALGAVPVFLLGRRLLSSVYGITFSVLYLICPLVQGVNWFDFHPEAFIPIGMFTAIYAMQARRWVLYSVGVLVALSSLEFSAVLLGVYALFTIVEERRSIISSLRSRSMFQPGPVALVTLVVSVVWILLALEVITIFNPLNAYYFGGLSSWTKLGAPSLVTVPLKAVEDPFRALQALSFDFPLKVLYVAMIFLPFLTIFKAVKFAFVPLPWLFVVVLSNFVPYYLLNTQYMAFYIAPLFAGSLFGLKAIRAKSVDISNAFSVSTIFAILAVAILASPLVTVPLAGNVVPGNYGFPTIDTHDRSVLRLISLIPSQASVLTQPNLFPLVSNRVNAFLFPYQTYYPPGTSFNSTLVNMVDSSDFVLLDTTDLVTCSWMINALEVRSTHGIYAAIGGVLLLRRGYHDAPVLFSPLQISLTPSDLTLVSGERVFDGFSSTGIAFQHTTSDASDATFWSGPGIVLAPGSYKVNFNLKVGSQTRGPLIYLKAVAEALVAQLHEVGGSGAGYNVLFTESRGTPQQLDFTQVYGENFTTVNSYESIQFSFVSPQFSSLDFTGANATDTSTLFLGEISLVETSPSI